MSGLLKTVDKYFHATIATFDLAGAEFTTIEQKLKESANDLTTLGWEGLGKANFEAYWAE